MIGGDHPRLPRGGHDDVGRAADLHEVTTATVRQSHRRIDPLSGQEQCCGQPHQARAPDHHGAPACSRDRMMLEQSKNAERGAGHQPGSPSNETAQ